MTLSTGPTLDTTGKSRPPSHCLRTEMAAFLCAGRFDAYTKIVLERCTTFQHYFPMATYLLSSLAGNFT